MTTTDLTERTTALYTLIAELPRGTFKTRGPALPPNGIYLFFERGESGSIDGATYDRIVRVGTHRVNGRYSGRLQNHFGSVKTLNGNKNASVFRRHVGGALMQRDHPDDPRLAEWSRQGGASDSAMEAIVSQHLGQNFTFVTIPVEDAAERLELETGLIALLAQAPILRPSDTWLGHHATHPAVRESGLWNTQQVLGTPLTEAQATRIADLLSAVPTPASPAPDGPYSRRQRPSQPHTSGSGAAPVVSRTQPRPRGEVPTLVIVPCGSRKIWGMHPTAGPTPARLAYTGAPFTVNRRYAERMGDRWVILSAMYGFIDPDDLVEEPYDVTFKRRSTDPISFDVLQQQVREQGLAQFGQVIALGGKEYQAAIQAAFAGTEVTLVSPFAGLRQGEIMRATNAALRKLGAID